MFLYFGAPKRQKVFAFNRKVDRMQLTLLTMHWVRNPGMSLIFAVFPSFSLTSCRMEAMTTCKQDHCQQNKLSSFYL